MPVTKALDQSWYDTANLHLCTIIDFLTLARECGARVERALALKATGDTRAMDTTAWSANIFAEGAIFLLKKA